jgi:NitT/TauT family transport system ATP-binding protein
MEEPVSQQEDAALAFRGTQLTYADGTEALRSADLVVRDGEFVSVVGPSGCGKSTLLAIASGLLEATGGDCEVDLHSIGYIFQDATLLPWRSVQRNVELMVELHRRPKEERRRAVRDNLRRVALDRFADSYPHRLSGGMRMRTSLARSLALTPRLFLFDEPFGALDEITRERLQDELLELHAKERFAALFITHSIQEACFLSNRVLVMSSRPGRIIAEFEVPFDYPRGHDIRYTPEFAALNGRVSAALRGSGSA